MEGFLDHNLFLSLLLVFFFSYSTLLSHSLSPSGTIERVVKQQVLATLPPLSHETSELGTSQLFLTSPSGKYSVFLLRRQTSIGAGGYGNDFLVFSEGGLEIFDGSSSAWDNNVEGDYLRELVLVDSGDMQIRDKDGELVWRASDNPIVNQNCGSIGAPGLAPALPPFASPVHGQADRGPFGQPLGNNVQQQTAQLAVPQEESQQTEADNPQQSGLNQPDELQAPAQQPEAGNPQQGDLSQPDELQVPAQQPDEQGDLSQPDEPQAPVQQPQAGNPQQGDLSQPDELQVPAQQPNKQGDLSQPGELQAPVQQPQTNQAHQQGNLNTPDELPQPEEDLKQPGEDLQQPDSISVQPAADGLSTQQPLSPSVHDHGHYQPATAAAFGGGAANTATQQPLIDNTPFDSGSTVINQSILGIALITTLCFSGFLF